MWDTHDTVVQAGRSAIRSPQSTSRWFAAAVFFVLLGPTYGQNAATYQTTSDWGQAFNGQINVLNTTGAPITQWVLTFDFDRSIDVIWNATVVSHSGNHYRVQSAGWNDTIPANGTISFGFGGSPGSVQQGPTNFQLSGAAGSPPPDPGPATPSAVGITMTQASQWDGGFSAILTIQNNGTEPISPWILSFDFDPSIQAAWNGTFTQSATQAGQNYQFAGAGPSGAIQAGGSVPVGFLASGTLSTGSARNCSFNGSACSVNIIIPAVTPPPGPPPVTPANIVISSVDDNGAATQFTVAQASTNFTLTAGGQSNPQFTVATNNPSVVSASINAGTLQVTGLQSGRASLRISETKSGTVRYVGVRVREGDGSLPGLPKYLSVGSVSEDTPEHLGFWQAFDDGTRNHRVDSRYIYLNGGPFGGWDTWTGVPGDRATSYIRNSRMLGMIPIFVFYNIADSGEGYQLDLGHVRDRGYMTAYFKNLKMALDIIAKESPDDPVEMILEPDFLGYLAQNANAPAASLSAATGAVYDSGVLSADADPQFPDSVAGLVQAINYTISKYAPHVAFGWQINLWASPAGGWTTPAPVTGLMHVTDTGDFSTQRAAIASEAAGIANYYLAAGVAKYGASFVSIDKYGLDAAGAELSAASNPAKSTWFWNNDQWGNYLTFAAAIHQTAKLPVILWQLPVGHINSSQELSPYSGTTFPDLPDTYQHYEDSAPTFFFGDTFATSGARLSFFSSNAGKDAGLTTSGQNTTWGEHMSAAANAGIVSMLFGAGVGQSTTNLGNPAGDNLWWITKAQEYFANPVLLPAQK